MLLWSCVLMGYSGSDTSILTQGQILSFHITKSGIYEINGTWLNDNFGVSLGNIPNERIKIYGISGGTLQENSTWEETERLRQIPVQIIDNGNNVLDGSDRFLFYVEGASTYKIDQSAQSRRYFHNPYALQAQYHIVISDQEQIPIGTPVDESIPQQPTSQYLHQDIYHEDITNLLGAEISNQGSGQVWYGKELSNEGTIDLNRFLPKRRQSLTDVKINIQLAGRSALSEVLELRSNEAIRQVGFSSVATGDVEELYARSFNSELQAELLRPEDPIELSFRKRHSEARLWLDYISIEGREDIRYAGSPLIINNIVGLKEGTDGLVILNGAGLTVWNISNMFETRDMTVFSSQLTDGIIATDVDKVEQYVIFDVDQLQSTPIPYKVIDPQDILTNHPLDMILVYPDILEEQALRLAAHRSEKSNILIKTVRVQEIYNTYSAGRVDPTSLRNYIRDLYRGGTGLKWVLLFGDASYDYRHLLKDLPDDNLVPTYETRESLDPLLAFPSDDYFALLDDGEGGRLRGDLDLAVGRLVVRTPADATTVVDKIIRYDSNASSDGRWQTQIAFMADDEDNNLHINDADRIAQEVDYTFPLFNQTKIFLDAFVQESTPGGNRYPAATQKLNTSIDQGILVLNYLGHGGPRGWAQERVLKIDDITSWTNIEKLPLVITATCSFTGFDDPALTTAGEAVLLQPNGGGIGLFTTVRSVYASKNFRLTRSVFREIFKKEDGLYLSIGEILMRAKNNNPNDNTNARKFLCIGDPSMKLSIPNNVVRTEKINSKMTKNAGIVDTLGALDRVMIEGYIENQWGDIAEDFSGVVDVTIYDKPRIALTLANDRGSFVKEYESQNSIIYRGASKVSDGRFEIDFRVPIDIDYTFGSVKISYHAISDDAVAATGFNEQLAIYGSSESSFADDEGPNIAIYLNTRNFINGSEVPKSSLMIVDLTDESGLNLSSAGIGHEMTAVLDGRIIILNDFFTPSLSDPFGGSIYMNLEDLTEGRHTLEVKAFDVFNNVGTAKIDFEVRNGLVYEVSDMYIYPNPALFPTISISMFSDIRASVMNMDIEIYNTLGELIEKHRQISLYREGRYTSTFRLSGGYSGMAVIKATLRSPNSEVNTDAIMKKVILLK